MPKFFALRKAASIAGIPYPTAARWIQQGLIHPPGYVGKQWATVPLGVKELRELCNIAQLRQVLSMQALRRAAAFLRQHGHNPYSSGRFMLLDGPRGQKELVKICDSGEAMELLKHPGQTVLLPIVDPETE